MKMLSGLGLYLWIIYRIEGGKQGSPPSPEKIAERAAALGLTHVLIKIADAEFRYNVHQGVDLVPGLVDALHARGIEAWGWQYIYGVNPIAEAKTAAKRVLDLRMDGFVVNAEVEFKQPGKHGAARNYMQALRDGLPATWIGFSSFRYPKLHRPLPFEIFLEYCDINMPQVYWVGADNPEVQLARSLKEYSDLGWTGHTIPTGAAYKERGWLPTAAQVRRFLTACADQGMAGANFWEWLHAVEYGYIDEFDTFAPKDPAAENPPRKDEETDPQISPDVLKAWEAVQRTLMKEGRPWAR